MKFKTVLALCLKMIHQILSGWINCQGIFEKANNDWELIQLIWNFMYTYINKIIGQKVCHCEVPGTICNNLLTLAYGYEPQNLNEVGVIHDLK